jgi:NTP pyrophosphatase (non-canonical NTP hydrolase)
MSDLADLRSAILRFRDQRNRAQFHTPRNLAAALAIEAAELQETLLWKTDTEIQQLLSSRLDRKEVEDEIADVLIFTLLMCEATGTDPVAAVMRKRHNRGKYPIASSRNVALKYTKLMPAKSSRRSSDD